MILQAVVRHLLVYRSCRVGSVVPSRTHHPLQSPPVLRGAVPEPGSDASCQDALHSEIPQLPEVIEALRCLPHQSVSVCSPSQILDVTQEPRYLKLGCHCQVG